MLSFNNDPASKEKFQLRFAAHREADEVIQGTGFENGRGCFIGCTMNKYDHESFARSIGPLWLAHLADTIFEGVPKSEAAQFGTDLLAAIPVGKDLENVRHMLAIARHKRQIERLAGNTEPYAQTCRDALQSVISYCEQQIVGFENESAAARSAAESARSAAWSAAESAESAAESARSAARSAAESNEFQIERDTLLAILRSL